MDTLWRVHKVDIAAYAAALSVAEPPTFPTKSSASLTDLNENAVDSLTTALATEFVRKQRCVQVTSTAQEEIISGSNSETET